MIWVTTLDDKATEDKINDFKKMYPLFKNTVIRKFNELLPVSLILGTDTKEFMDYCGDDEIQMLNDFFQGYYSFTLFHFLIRNTRSSNGLLRYEMSKEPRSRLARFISMKWTVSIKAQNFLSDQTLDKDKDFMALLKQLPPCDAYRDFLFRPPSLFGDFFRDLYEEVVLDKDFLLRNNCIDFNTLKSYINEVRLSPHRKYTKTIESLFAFYNHKTRKLLFHYRGDDDYVFKILSPIC